MTLIPLISAIVATPKAVTAPVGGARLARDSYNPGASHRPVAAAFAVGLPLALVVAVALSPMIIKDKPDVTAPPWKSFTVEKPKPPETPPAQTAKDQAKPKSNTVIEAVKPIVDTFPPTDTGTPVKPFVPDPRPYDPGPTVRPADPPAPKLVFAELDSRFAGSFQPDYPASEQRREIEGSAKVRVLIGADGRVKAVEQISSDSPGFFEETKRRALAKWRFKPATRGGVAEESWKVMTVHFQIRNG